MDAPSPERWALISEILGDALLRPEEEREAFLEQACKDDADLREEIERLIDAYEEAAATERFDQGALDLVPFAFPRPDPPPSVGAYRLIHELGHGGMGSVWLAERADGVYERKVAIKLMNAGFLPTDARRRFDAERRILARLDHPNIARILDGGVTDNGQPFLVMEYVQGVPITDFCRERALSVTDRLRLFLTVCRAVAYAHQNLVVHRDLKPSNILVTDAAEAKLLDFGIAKLLSDEDDGSGAHPATQTGMSLMTPEYAAPEQVASGTVTTATDVYALGIVLFELLTGERPYSFPSRTPGAVEQVVCYTEPARPSTVAAAHKGGAPTTGRGERLARRLRGDLDTIILAALRKEPERRYGSAEQLAEDVRRHLSGMPISTRPDTLHYRASKFIRRYRKFVVAAAAVFLTLIAGIFATAWQARIAEMERVRAEQRFEDVRELAGTFLFEFHDAIRDLPGSTPARELVVERALEYLDKLAGEAGDDPDLQLELAAAYRRVGNVQGNPTNANLGRTADALQSYQQALSILERSAAPSEARLLARSLTLEKLADVEATTGDLEAAGAAIEEAVDGFRVLAERHPDDAEDQLRHVVGLIKQGDLLGNPNFPNQGDAPAALSRYVQAKPILELVRGRDPANARAYRLLGLVEERIGTVHGVIGDHAEALEAFRRSLDIRQRYVEQRPNDLDAVRDLAIAHEKMGIAASASGDLAEAAQRHGYATDVFRSLAAADSQNVQAWHSLAISLLHEGDLALRVTGTASNTDRQAAAYYREAIALLDELSQADPTNSRTKVLMDHVQAQLGQVQ